MKFFALGMVSLISYLFLGCQKNAGKPGPYGDTVCANDICITGGADDLGKSITGQVNFGRTITKGTNIVLYSCAANSFFSSCSISSGANGIGTLILAADASSLTFKISKLEPIFPGDPENYVLGVSIDVDNSSTENAGDLIGCYLPTSMASTVSETCSSSNIIDLSSLDSTSINFTLIEKGP